MCLMSHWIMTQLFEKTFISSRSIVVCKNELGLHQNENEREDKGALQLSQGKRETSELENYLWFWSWVMLKMTNSSLNIHRIKIARHFSFHQMNRLETLNYISRHIADLEKENKEKIMESKQKQHIIRNPLKKDKNENSVCSRIMGKFIVYI